MIANGGYQKEFSMHGTKFYRPARSHPPVLPVDDVVIKAPPTIQQNRTGWTGMLIYLLPALGGVGSLIFVFANPGNPLYLVAGIVMAFSFVGSGIGMGFLQRYWYKKQMKQQRKLYLEYLEQYRTHLQQLADEQDM